MIQAGGVTEKCRGYLKILRYGRNISSHQIHNLRSHRLAGLKFKGGSGGKRRKERKKERKRERERERAKMQLSILGRGVIRSAGGVAAGRWSLVLNLIFLPPLHRYKRSHRGRQYVPRENVRNPEKGRGEGVWDCMI